MIVRTPHHVGGGSAIDAPVQVFVEADVEDARRRAGFRLQHLGLAFGGIQAAADVAFRIVDVAEKAGAADAGFDTGREQPGFEPMAAKGAFVGFAGVVVDEACVVGAGLDAIGAADAAFAVHQHHAVRALEGGAHRADRDAGWLLAVVAQPGQHGQAGVAGLRRDGIGGDDGAEFAFRRNVFHRTGHGAGLAGDAATGVDQHRPVRAGFFRSLGRQGQTGRDRGQGGEEGTSGKIRMSAHAKLRF